MTDSLLQAMARAIKDEIARQFDATPLPGPNPGNDWSATGGKIELEPVAKAALTAHDKHLAEQGVVVVPREKTATVLNEVWDTMAHAEVFIQSREKMHPDGRKLWLECKSHVAQLLTAYEQER